MRPSWDEYFMEIAYKVSERSTCIRRQVGAVLVKNKQIISTGYNGSIRGTKHCIDDPNLCLRSSESIPTGERLDLCRAIHAEINAIIQAARNGISTDGCTLYVTTRPCRDCFNACYQAGIVRFIYSGEYTDPRQHGDIEIKMKHIPTVNGLCIKAKNEDEIGRYREMNAQRIGRSNEE